MLHDLIDSGVILPVVQLTEVFRQAMESHIISNAHRIVEGKTPELAYKERRFFFLIQTSPSGGRRCSTCAAGGCPTAMAFPVFRRPPGALSPGKRGSWAPAKLNRPAGLLKPAGGGTSWIRMEGVLLRMGDKVMHTRNNYDIGWTRDDGSRQRGDQRGYRDSRDIDPREDTPPCGATTGWPIIPDRTRRI